MNGMQDVSRSRPAVIAFHDAMLAWDYQAPGESNAVRSDLFGLSTYNAHLLGIGSQILARKELQQGFIGVHLRCRVFAQCHAMGK